MNKHIEIALKLRDNPDVHYNCAQSMLCAYSDELGLSEKTCFDLGFNFGSGMKYGGICGAISAAYMILGLFGINDVNILNKFKKDMADKHEGMTNCVDLLRANALKGGVKKVHCDGMISEAIELIDEIIAQQKAH